MTSDKAINKSITIQAPASKVWETLTNPGLMKIWMTETVADIISDFKIGSPFVIKFSLHGKPFENKGTILQFEPEKIFQYTSWSKLSRLADKPENYTTITFTLTPAENKTTLALTLDNLIAETALEHSNHYWNVVLDILRELAEKENS